MPQLYRTQEDETTTLPLNLQLDKGMRVVQQDACYILGAVFHRNGGDMGKRNTEKPVLKPEVRTAATLVLVSERLEYQYCTVAGCNKTYVNNSFFPWNIQYLKIHARN